MKRGRRRRLLRPDIRRRIPRKDLESRIGSEIRKVTPVCFHFLFSAPAGSMEFRSGASLGSDQGRFAWQVSSRPGAIRAIYPLLSSPHKLVQFNQQGRRAASAARPLPCFLSVEIGLIRRQQHQNWIRANTWSFVDPSRRRKQSVKITKN